MKVLFLDVDGVLNNAKTKERTIDLNTGEEFTGVDKKLAELFTSWHEKQPSLSIVLSSTWRLFPGMHHSLKDVGIHWMDITPSKLSNYHRGNEIIWWLDKHPEVTQFAILDDLRPENFQPSHRQFLVQTNPEVGLTSNDLIKLNSILVN